MTIFIRFTSYFRSSIKNLSPTKEGKSEFKISVSGPSMAKDAIDLAPWIFGK